MATETRKTAEYKEKMRKRRARTMSWLNILGIGFLSLVILVIGRLFLKM